MTGGGSDTDGDEDGGDEPVESHLRAALAAVDDERGRYHIRQALQLLRARGG